MKKFINIGIIGASGWMGKVHSKIYNSYSSIFGSHPAFPKIHTVCEINEELAKKCAENYNATNWTTDWKKLVQNKEIDIVDICSPTSYHFEMTMQSLKNNKHVYCEKPLASNPLQTKQMYNLAKKKKLINVVGFNYMHNPIISEIKKLIQKGKLGKIISVRAIHNVNFMADPMVPYSWRSDKKLNGGGFIADAGSHVFAFLQYLIGDIDKIFCYQKNFINKRPYLGKSQFSSAKINTKNIKYKKVTSEDEAKAICEFNNGASGYIEVNRVATGFPLEQSITIIGSKSSIIWNYDKLNEIQIYENNDNDNESGFKKIISGPWHKDYSPFFPVPGSGMGYNEHKMIEIHRMIQAFNGKKSKGWCNFLIGHKVQKYIEAAKESHNKKKWIKIG